MTPRLISIIGLGVSILIIYFTMFFPVNKTRSSHSTANSTTSRSVHIATLHYTSNGCFNHTEARLILFSQSGQTKIEYVGNKKAIIKVIDSVQKDSVISFLKHVESLKGGGGCTTVSLYQVDFDGRKFKKLDAHCGWDGYEGLMGFLEIPPYE